MAEPESEPVESQPQHGGGLRGALKRIKPGEWVLIAIGIASIVFFYIWYQQRQGSSTSSTTSPDPNWQNADAQGSGLYDSELAALLTEIASGQWTTPGTSVTTLGGSGGTTSGGNGSIGGSALGTGSHPGIVGTGQVDRLASSGSGLTHRNQSPVHSATAAVHNRTGSVGVPIEGTTHRAPANVSKSIPESTQSGGQTHGSMERPTPPRHAPANVSRSVPARVGGGEAGSHPPRPHAHTVPPVKVKTPRHAPVNVRPR